MTGSSVTRVASGPRVGTPEAVLEALMGANRIVMTTHLNADGDGTGCQGALAHFLGAAGKQVHVVNPTPFPNLFRFLMPDGGANCVLDAASERAQSVCADADLAVVLDTGEVPRIGRVKPMIDDLPKVIIDHHEPGPRPIRGVELRDAGASATGELVFELVEAAGGPWTPEIASALYVAIMTDTGGFRFSNSSPRCFQVASRLVENGASPEELYSTVFGNFTTQRYHLLSEALATLEVSADGRVAWIVVPTKAYRELGATPEDLEGFVDVPRSIQGVQVALLFRETVHGKVKISFRSKGTADVNALAGVFGGGGHVKASGALVDGELEEVVQRVVEQATQLAHEGAQAEG
ncbi:MAG: DHH family phosphoesterase [Longimicrobiales bacterium]